MSTGYEDNFGFTDLNFVLEHEFILDLKARSVPKTCQGCSEPVMLLPEKTVCARCMFNREMGWETA